MNENTDREELAMAMWLAYSQQAGGKTFDGKPLPTWEELGDERQQCWFAAAEAAMSICIRWYADA
jgi:hypothetical protein